MTTPPADPATVTDAGFSLDRELDRQVQVLVDLGYPALMGATEATFRAGVEPLREPLRSRVEAPGAPSPSRLPFVLVVSRDLVPVSARVPLLELAGRPGRINQHFTDADQFAPVIEVPSTDVYALVEVERGEEFCGVPPAEATRELADRGRLPVTIEEGLALLHVSPGSLEPNRCFHTAGSRRGDRRVPALWISAKAPMLGWCWEQNHHTWLGVASVGDRLAA